MDKMNVSVSYRCQRLVDRNQSMAIRRRRGGPPRNNDDEQPKQTEETTERVEQAGGGALFKSRVYSLCVYLLPFTFIFLMLLWR